VTYRPDSQTDSQIDQRDDRCPRITQRASGFDQRRPCILQRLKYYHRQTLQLEPALYQLGLLGWGIAQYDRPSSSGLVCGLSLAGCSGYPKYPTSVFGMASNREYRRMQAEGVGFLDHISTYCLRPNTYFTERSAIASTSRVSECALDIVFIGYLLRFLFGSYCLRTRVVLDYS
jgi:hypothetical protein